MRPLRLLLASAAAAALLGTSGIAAAQGLGGANYTLARPLWSAASGDPDFTPRAPFLKFGTWQLATARSGSGNGLSLQAGDQWFARLDLGRAEDAERFALGAGYRFADGDALSMRVTRQLGQERLGLALRYDWTRSWLRLSYESGLGPASTGEMVRFQAGMRF